MPEEKKEEARIAIIRVRGKVHVKAQIDDTLSLMNLNRKNHCTIIDKRPEYIGMLHKVNDYVTWGEIKPEVIAKLIETRGSVSGERKVSDESVSKNTKYKTVKEFAQAVSENKTALTEIPDIKPFFRLNPPKKGFERGGIKKPYKLGGALGYRGEKINDLILRML